MFTASIYHLNKKASSEGGHNHSGSWKLGNMLCHFQIIFLLPAIPLVPRWLCISKSCALHDYTCSFLKHLPSCLFLNCNKIPTTRCSPNMEKQTIMKAKMLISLKWEPDVLYIVMSILRLQLWLSEIILLARETGYCMAWICIPKYFPWQDSANRSRAWVKPV